MSAFNRELVAGKADLGVALVTGASTGIGRATAKALKDAGFRVFGTSRRPVSESPDGITMLIGDVTDDALVAKLVDEVIADAGRIDLLVNNAGVGLLGGAEESSIAQAQALFDVNLFGVLRVTNAVLPTMRRQASGRIINMSSVMGLIPAPYLALYASTKHALEGYSESLDHALGSGTGHGLGQLGPSANSASVGPPHGQLSGRPTPSTTPRVMSEKGSKTDTEPSRLNVAEVPIADMRVLRSCDIIVSNNSVRRCRGHA